MRSGTVEHLFAYGTLMCDDIMAEAVQVVKSIRCLFQAWQEGGQLPVPELDTPRWKSSKALYQQLVEDVVKDPG